MKEGIKMSGNEFNKQQMNIPARKTYAAISNAVKDVVFGVGLANAIHIGVAAIKVDGLWYVVCDYKEGDKIMVRLFSTTDAEQSFNVTQVIAKAGA